MKNLDESAISNLCCRMMDMGADAAYEAVKAELDDDDVITLNVTKDFIYIHIPGYTLIRNKGYWHSITDKPIDMDNPVNKILARAGLPVVRF